MKNISILSQTPFCDPRTGIINNDWKLWLIKLAKTSGAYDGMTNIQIEENILKLNNEFENLSLNITRLNEITTLTSNKVELLEQNVTLINQDIIILNNTVNQLINSVNSVKTDIMLINNKIDGLILDIENINLKINALINDGENLGDGNVIFKQKSLNKLQFKTVKAGTNVTITNDDNTVTISATGGSSETNNLCFMFNKAIYLTTQDNLINITDNLENSIVLTSDKLFYYNTSWVESTNYSYVYNTNQVFYNIIEPTSAVINDYFINIINKNIYKYDGTNFVLINNLHKDFLINKTYFDKIVGYIDIELINILGV